MYHAFRIGLWPAILVGFLGSLSTLGTGAERFPAVANSCLDLSGADWRIHEDSDGKGVERGLFAADSSVGGWIAATVPGNIQADVEAAHQLKPLWYGAGDPRLYDVAGKDWWYRKDFVVPADFQGKRITLVFEGVDHECEVWLNGKWLGKNAGMFRRFWFDVAHCAKPGATNQLAVRIARIPAVLAPLVPATDGFQSGGFVEAIVKTRQVLKELKSPTNFGWDWGVNVWTLGIWKDVRLVATGPARIDWARVQTKLNDRFTKATVAPILEVDSLVPQTVQARFRIFGNGQEAATVYETTLKQGGNRIAVEMPLDHPALWWCNGQGQQPRYTLDVQLRGAGGTLLDAHRVRFAVRDVRWVHTEGAPKDYVSRFQLVLNGRPVRTMGSCMIPPDLLFGRACPRGLDLLRRAKDANMNMIRLWGGGVILPEQFHARADELGIMLSLEFPLANSWPETDAVFLGNLEQTARNIVKQVRNHASIIEYTGGNEMPWNSLTKHPAWELLQKVVREEDDRLIRATCPDLGAAHSPWDSNIDSVCGHYDGSHPMRYGEFGTQTPANLEVWQRTIPPKAQWPIRGEEDPILGRKNVVQAVFSSGHWLLKPRIDNVFGTLDNLPDLIQAGQFLAAEQLRYAMDALRRQGKLVGGFTSWDFNEPWTNGAGSYMVDYDGRTLMNYDFVKQALAPVSLSLKYPSIVYDPSQGLDLEVWLTSDAPQVAKDLKWQLLARDRHGSVFLRHHGTAAIEPLEAKQLKKLHLSLPKETCLGPIFVEMQLHDARDHLLGERLHVFSSGASTRGSFGGMLVNRIPDTDDVVAMAATERMGLRSPANLAFVGNGAKPARASSEIPGFPGHRAAGLNDGIYGNEHSWIGNSPKSWFVIDLGKVAEVGRFRLGATAVSSIEIVAQTSWPSTCLSTRSNGRLFSPRRASPNCPASNLGPRWKFALRRPRHDSFAGPWPRSRRTPKSCRASTNSRSTPPLRKPAARYRKRRSIRRRFATRPLRTRLQATAQTLRVEGSQEVLDLTVANTGKMTALFCEPHPLIEYRTDLFIENNHCFIPPGETRTVTIRASANPAGGLNLAQTGWRLSTWNADGVLIEPSSDVVLAVGRRDQMCREFAGYFEPTKLPRDATIELTGRLPHASTLPCLLRGRTLARFRFAVSAVQAACGASLRLHTADQAATSATALAITVNGRSFATALPTGLGIQTADPAHLAFPATTSVDLPAGTLKAGENLVEIRVTNGGWLTWDALDVTTLFKERP